MKEIKELENILKKLTAIEKNRLSLKHAFLKGIFYGLGFFVGSALLVATAIYILSLFNTAPIIGDYINKILLIIQNK